MISQQGIEKMFIDTIKLESYVKEVSEELKKKTFLTMDYLALDKFIAGYFSGIENTIEVLMTRAYILGQVMANDPTRKLKGLPEMKDFKRTTRSEAALEYVSKRGAYALQQATDQTKMKTREIIYRDLKDNLGWRSIAKHLRQEIREDGELQRFWTRVAITETTAAINNGYLASKENGTLVIGQGYEDACKYCKDLIIGKVYRVGNQPTESFEDHDPLSKEYKDLVKHWENYVWVGKDNIGRSGSPTKREAGSKTTVTRLRHELYFPTAPLHVNCYAKDVEVYTDKGWKFFEDLDKTEKIMTINQKTLQMEWQKPSHYIKYKHDGEMIRIHNKNIDITVTPDHNMFVAQRKDYVNRSNYSYTLKQACNLDTDDSILISPEYNKTEKSHHHKKSLDINGLMFYEKEFAAFMGYYLSEGCYISRVSATGKDPRTNWAIKISQEKEPNTTKIYNDILRPLKRNKINLNKRKGGLYFDSKPLWQYLYKFGKSYEKYIPEIIKAMSKEAINIFLDAYILGDGHIKISNGLNQQKKDSVGRIIFTSSKRLSDDLAELILKSGCSVSYKLIKTKGLTTKFKNGDYVCNHNMHHIVLKTSKYVTDYKKEVVNYNDYVYCVTVPNETLLVRSNGKVLFSGNCRCLWVSFDPNIFFADKRGQFIPKTSDNKAKWEDWYSKNIKDRFN